MISRFCRFSIVAACLLRPLAAAPPLTTIQDILYKADGTRFNGTLTISWSSFQAPDSSAIVTQSTTVKVQDGLLRVQLVPTTTSTPPSTYNVTYNSDGRVQFQETWSVPSSTQPLRVRDVRIAASTQTSGNGVAAPDTNLAPIPESGVVGLVADLGARPTKSPAFAPSRAAVVDAGGLIATAAGSPSDCVHVDGSSGPCGGGAPAFIDADSPFGIVDGANTIFGLSTAPDPAGSLAVYRNGMLQKIGQDYTLSGSTVAFVAAATPQPGDTLLASYRVAGDANAGAAASFASPQVVCSGSGTSTNAATLSVLGTCRIPAGLLAPGDRVELRFDYAHAGTLGAVSMEVNWGGTTLAHRDAGSTETLITGRAGAAIVNGGAELSAETWGTALPFSASLTNAGDSYASGLTITFRGSAGQSSDSITLANFSVLRMP